MHVYDTRNWAQKNYTLKGLVYTKMFNLSYTIQICFRLPNFLTSRFSVFKDRDLESNIKRVT